MIPLNSVSYHNTCLGNAFYVPSLFGSPEDDGTIDGSSAHVERLGRRVDDLIDGLHCEVERHELDDGSLKREKTK